jgi:hypothetical protein
MKSTTGFFAMAVAAAGLLLAPAANAQNKSPSPPASPGSTTQSADIPDSKLDAVAAAAKKVSTLAADYEQKLAQAPAGEKERIAGEANQVMTKAVTDQGLSVEEYTTVLKTAQNDPVLRDKLVQRLK